MPLKLGFVDGTSPTWDVIDNIVDGFFLIDIILTFFTPFYEKNFLVISFKKIALNYICSFWFFVDVLSIFPFQTLFADFFNEEMQILAKAGKLPKLYRVVKNSWLSFSSKSVNCSGL